MGNDAHYEGPSRVASDRRWYDLFSRGARDWLRHNERIRESVRKNLMDMVTGSDILSRPGDRTMRVPVKLLEHYRFRLREERTQQGVGQGETNPGDVYRTGEASGGEGDEGPGGSGDGELQFVLELQMEDVIDWVWETLELPYLKPKTTDSVTEKEYQKEGWGRQGPRALLDRRRTMKEAIKRRAALGDNAPPFSNDDLRFRQWATRQQPSTDAVVAFLLDVSGSMDEARRKLAKTFFFWAVQGLRRQYNNLELVFIAHTNEAWEFTEEEFFQAYGTGGTISSSAFQLAQTVLDDRYSGANYNRYVFYASDGDNFADDQVAAQEALSKLADTCNFVGFLETPRNPLEATKSEMGRLFRSLQARSYAVDSYTVHEHQDIWQAIRELFRQQAEESGETV